MSTKTDKRVILYRCTGCGRTLTVCTGDPTHRVPVSVMNGPYATTSTFGKYETCGVYVRGYWTADA